MELDLSNFTPKLIKKNNELLIWDAVRAKYLVLTPEEWVRQAIIYFLDSNHYPLSLLQIERGITYPNLQKRPDIVVYDRSGNPFLLIECKASHIALNERTLQQALAYNWVLQAPYFALTNGKDFWVCDVAKQLWLDSLPPYD